MARNETALVGQIHKAIVKAHPDALVWKIHGGQYQEAGIPDLVICVSGRFIGLEVKNQGPTESEQHARERATPGQRLQIARIIKAGGTAEVVLSMEEALAVIARALETKE